MLPLRRTAYHLCGSWHVAEELVQEAFIKLYLSWDRVRDSASLDGYVRQILVRTYLETTRRSWFRRILPTAEPPEPAPVVAVDSDHRMDLTAALAPARRPAQRRRRSCRRRAARAAVGGVAAFAVVAIATTAVVAVGSGGGGDGGSGTQPDASGQQVRAAAPQTAVALLERASLAAGERRVDVRGDQFVYEMRQFVTRFRAPTQGRTEVAGISESWKSVDGTRPGLSMLPDKLGRPATVEWPVVTDPSLMEPTYTYLTTVTTDPDALLAQVYALVDGLPGSRVSSATATRPPST